MKLEGKLGNFLGIETNEFERLQTVRAVNDSAYPQKEDMQPNFAYSLPQVLTKYAVLSIGSFELALWSGVFSERKIRSLFSPFASLFLWSSLMFYMPCPVRLFYFLSRWHNNFCHFISD